MQTLFHKEITKLNVNKEHIYYKFTSSVQTYVLSHYMKYPNFIVGYIDLKLAFAIFRYYSRFLVQYIIRNHLIQVAAEV